MRISILVGLLTVTIALAGCSNSGPIVAAQNSHSEQIEAAIVASFFYDGKYENRTSAVHLEAGEELDLWALPRVNGLLTVWANFSNGTTAVKTLEVDYHIDQVTIVLHDGSIELLILIT